MANTNTLTTLLAGRNTVVVYLTLSSDGTEETDYVVFDSSAQATTIGVTDPTDCVIESIYATLSAAATARAWLEFDATTDILAIDIPPQQVVKNDFRPIGGLKNTAGSGITGDITLTTTGLESGDKLTLVLRVKIN